MAISEKIKEEFITAASKEILKEIEEKTKKKVEI